MKWIDLGGVIYQMTVDANLHGVVCPHGRHYGDLNLAASGRSDGGFHFVYLDKRVACDIFASCRSIRPI